MAPKRELASEAAPSRAKKGRTSPVDARCKQVIDGLRDSELPETALQTFTDAVAHSLGVVREERHPFQERVIEAIADIFGTTDARLEKAIETARVATKEIQQKISDREVEAEGAAAKLARLQGEMKTHKVQLAEDARVFQAAKARLQEKIVNQTHGLNELRSATEQKAQVEGLAKEMGTIHEATTGTRACEGFIQRLLKHVDIDESMKTAMPCTLTKAPSAHGNFDKMVIEQLHESIEKRIKKIDEMIANSDQVKESLEKDVVAAKSENDEAMKKQISSARAFTAASGEVNAADEDLKTIRKDVVDLKKQLKKTERQVGEAEANSELFKDGPMAALTFLRERTAPVPEQTGEQTGDVAPAPSDIAASPQKVAPQAVQAIGEVAA